LALVRVKSVRCGARAVWHTAVVALLTMPAISHTGIAAEWLPGYGSAPEAPRLEVWVGAIGTADAWSVYTGGTYAPFGSLHKEGWRIRAVAGSGQYRSGRTPHVFFDSSFADALVGYQLAFGSVTLKAFAGATADIHEGGGNAVGWKVAVETWINISDQDWASVDLAYGHAHETYSARFRIGHRIRPNLSLGVEGAALGVSGFNVDTAMYDDGRANYDGQRAGGFVRYEWGGGEASLSGGVTNDAAHPMGAYASFCWLTKF
jgi:hypothetical protein